MQRPSFIALSIIAGLGLAACHEDPPPPDEVRSRISTDLASVLTESHGAYQGGTEAMPGAAASAVIDRMFGTSSTIGLAHDAVSVTVDLDDAWHAAVALAKIFGEELPNASLSGQITGRLEVLGAAHAKATLDIDRAVKIAFAPSGVALDGPDAQR